MTDFSNVRDVLKSRSSQRKWNPRVTGFEDDKLTKNDSTPTRTKSGFGTQSSLTKAAKTSEVRYELDAIDQLKNMKENLCKQVFLVRHVQK